MLNKIKTNIQFKKDFAFETTLSGKTYLPILYNAISNGYSLSLFFFYLKSKKIAIQRVKARVSEGGHDVPVNDIERRYEAGLNNLMNLYIPLVHYWCIYDNSIDNNFKIVAEGDNLDFELTLNVSTCLLYTSDAADE